MLNNDSTENRLFKLAEEFGHIVKFPEFNMDKFYEFVESLTGNDNEAIILLPEAVKVKLITIYEILLNEQKEIKKLIEGEK